MKKKIFTISSLIFIIGTIIFFIYSNRWPSGKHTITINNTPKKINLIHQKSKTLLPYYDGIVSGDLKGVWLYDSFNYNRIHIIEIEDLNSSIDTLVCYMEKDKNGVRYIYPDDQKHGQGVASLATDTNAEIKEGDGSSENKTSISNPWQESVNKIEIGMTCKEVSKILPPNSSTSTLGTGGSQSHSYWLDENWCISITYDFTGIARDKNGVPQEIEKSLLSSNLLLHH